MTLRTGLGALAGASLVVGVGMAAASPPDRLQGEFAKLLYVHVPTSWLAFLAFGVTMVASIGWLARKQWRWDDIASASAEIGIVFTVLSLLTGMLWGSEVWGVAWDWGDARLTSTAIMLFVYIGYMALRRAITDDTTRADRSAVVGIAAFAMVPVVYFSVNLFRTLHQTQSIRPDGSTMGGEFVAPLLVNLAAFTILYLYLLLTRRRLAAADRDRPVVSDADVMAPDLDGIANG